MTTRPAPTPTATSTVYRLRLDNLLLALVLCGLVAAAVPMVYASIKHRTAQPGAAATPAKAAASTFGTARASATPTMNAAQAVASANALLVRGQFAAAMQLVANLSGPDADAADASGMRNRISVAETTFNADVIAMRDGAASSDWAAVVGAAREARTLAPLPADLTALAARASTELSHSTALDTATSAFQQRHFNESLKLARDGFAHWKTNDFRDLMVSSLAAIAAASKPTGATGAATAPHSTASSTSGSGAAASTRPTGTTSTHGAHAAHSTAPAADTTRPAAPAGTTGQGELSNALTASQLANNPAFAGIDASLLADALRMLGPNGLAQLQAAGMKLG